MTMSMMDKDYAPLPATCVRNLNDKLYEKRKIGALEVERMVRDYQVTGQIGQIRKVLKVLGDDLALSHNPNARKGGVIGLAATAIALGKDSNQYVSELVRPVLASFNDQDSRVRYYACEALYNISKVCRGFVLPYFNEIFDGLSKLASDTDSNVKNGTELLDRLIKDIVTESSYFDLKAFIPLLRERVYAKDPSARQFIVSWISVLNSVPDINMLVLLPEILEGLFEILADSNQEIRKMCKTALEDFLNDIKQSDGSGVKFEAMANILIIHSQSSDALTQYTALVWLQEFVIQANRTMLQYTPGIISAVLPCLDADGPTKKNVCEAAKSLNLAVLSMICEDDDLPTPTLGSPINDEDKSVTNTNPQSAGSQSPTVQLDVAKTIEVLCKMLQHTAFKTRISSLEWLCHLLLKVPNKTFRHVDHFFPGLLKTLSDESQEVVLLDLEVLAEISSNPAGHFTQTAIESENMTNSNKDRLSKQSSDNSTKTGLNIYFTKFMKGLLDLFKKDRQLLEPEEKGYYIIRQLSQLLNVEDVFQSFSRIIMEEEDMEFACKMVQSLNSILLTSMELFDLRSKLKSLKTQESCSLFCCLYKSWCYSPVATVSLCFLTQNYHHACELLQTFGDLEVTVDFLKEIDKLVQLIESPIFAYLRLQLLDVQTHQDLIKSLYGLLMLLPQSEAFKLLRNRLDCVPHYQLAIMNDKIDKFTEVYLLIRDMPFIGLSAGFSTIYNRQRSKSSSDQRPLVAKINFQELLHHFHRIQAEIRESRRKINFKGSKLHH